MTLVLVFVLLAASLVLAAVPLMERFARLEFGSARSPRIAGRLARLADAGRARRLVRARPLLCGGLFLLGVLVGEGLTGRIVLGVLLAGMAALGWDRYLALAVDRREKLLADQLPDMITTVNSAVRAGNSVPQALETVAQQFPPPLGPEVAELVRTLKMGMALDAALWAWVERVPLEDLRIFATALIIQRQTGGNLTDILTNLADTMRERRRIAGQIRALTAQGRMSGTILALLPVFLFAVLYVLDPAHMALMFVQPLGIAMLGASAVMILAGSLLIRRIVAIDV